MISKYKKSSLTIAFAIGVAVKSVSTAITSPASKAIIALTLSSELKKYFVIKYIYLIYQLCFLHHFYFQNCLDHNASI